MINLIKLECPNCGANLEVKNDVRQCFCTYCGTKILINNENEMVIRNIDEAKIKEAEYDYNIRLKQLEEEKATRQAEIDNKTEITAKIKERQKVCLIVAGIVGIVSLIFFPLGIPFACYLVYYALKKIPEKEQESRMMETGGVRFPNGLTPFKQKNYQTIVAALENAGFTNIVCNSLHDVKLDLLQKSGKVENITVNGNILLTGGRVFPSNVPIVITYHGK